MRRFALLTALFALLAAPSAGQAATRYTLRGAGFGHGIGMSQYGAYGYAQNGRGYAEILRHYYQGTSLGKASNKPVRVLLQASDPYVRVRGASKTSTGTKLTPKTIYVARRASGGRISLRKSSGGRVGTFRSGVRLFRSGHSVRLLGRAINGVRSGKYHGSIQLRSGAAGGVTAINWLPIDNYVRGVVGGEMPSSWAPEALKVQAVAARTYALATRKRGGAFDVYPDTRSQVYRGVTAETSSTNAAVRATARRIVTYRGAPIVTYYFSSSGGQTENIENSFLGAEPEPYLTSVKDPYDSISPRHRWRKRYSASRLGRALGARGSLRKVKVIKRGRSPRVVRARIYGSRGNRILTGSQIRSRLGLYDTWVYFSRVSSSSSSRGRASAASASRSIGGVFDPRPRSRRMLVERRSGRTWKRVGVARTTRGGRYRAVVARKGVYRVRSGAVSGPPVRVR